VGEGDDDVIIAARVSQLKSRVSELEECREGIEYLRFEARKAAVEIVFICVIESGGGKGRRSCKIGGGEI